MDIDCNARQYSRQQLDLARLKRSLAMGRHRFSDDEMGDEYDAPNTRRSRSKQTSLFPGYFFVLAAWGSLIIPVCVVVSFLAGLAVLGQYKREHNWVLGVSFLACVVGAFAGIVSFTGVRWVRPLVIVPPALIGVLLNLLVGFVAFIVFALSGIVG
jgi:lipopolysaccharide export LptBFGC system permease protein LptF